MEIIFFNGQKGIDPRVTMRKTVQVRGQLDTQDNRERGESKNSELNTMIGHRDAIN